jgi:hypothetical protein
MISWIIFGALLLVSVVLVLVNLKHCVIKAPGKRDQFSAKPLSSAIITFVVGIVLSIVNPYVAERVDSGNVGVRVNLTGNDRGVSDVAFAKGWVIYNSFSEQLFEFPTFQQHIEYDKQQVILKGGFSTVIQPTFNYSLRADMVTDMFIMLRLDIRAIEAGWMKTAIMASVNDVSNRWEVDEIFNHREKFENEILADCNKRIGKWFEVSQLKTNIVPPASIQASIEAKTKAVQMQQAKMIEITVIEAEGKKQVAQARADSAKAVIAASGKAEALIISAEAEAEAIKIKQREITPTYNDYIRSKKWDGKYPSTMAGSGTGILLDARK